MGNKKLKSAVRELLHQVSELNVRVTQLEYPPKEDDVLDLNKELEVGKWYKYPTISNWMVCVSELNNSFMRGYGFNAKSKWMNESKWMFIDDNLHELVEATPQEVESALIEEAKRRGFVKGAKTFSFGDDTDISICLDTFCLSECKNQLRVRVVDKFFTHRLIFNNGKWAEVIKNDDKFAELKEAHKNGAIIEYKHASLKNDTWLMIENPSWNPTFEYRIKPEEKPKVGDWQTKIFTESDKYKVYTNSLVKLCHGLAKDAGWHDKPREVGTMLALIHSEVSEAMEGFRKDLNDDHLTHRKMAEVELADAVIRIFDLAGVQGFDLGGALVEKLVYNTQRSDHKIENRQGENGKKF